MKRIFLAFVTVCILNLSAVAEEKVVPLDIIVENSGTYTYKSWSPAQTLNDDENAYELFDISDEPEEYYNSLELGYVSPVKNQGSSGTCWAFANCGALESFFLKNNYPEYDFSEDHMKYAMSAAYNNPHGFNLGVNSGGITPMIFSYYINRYGPVYESDAPFCDTDEKQDYGITANKPVSGFDITEMKMIDSLPYSYSVLMTTSKSANIKKEKNFIKQYGAVMASIYYNSSYVNGGNSIYYTASSSSECKASNHKVTVVGWDDNYSKNNFKAVNNSLPAGDGAFIIKNSWGNQAGNNGYFYLSYYDVHSCEEVIAITGIKEKRDDEILNSYIPFCSTSGLYYDNYQTLYYGNVYYKKYDDEKLKSVSAYLFSHQTYDIELIMDNPVKNSVYIMNSDHVYIDSQWMNISDSAEKTILFQGITPEYDGFYTFDLPEQIDITSDKYIIKVKATTSSYSCAYAPNDADVYVQESNGNIYSVTNLSAEPLEAFFGLEGWASFIDFSAKYNSHFEINTVTTSQKKNFSIDYLSITDSDGVFKEDFSEGDNIKICPVVNQNNLEGSTLICAVYDGNKLVNVMSKTFENNNNVFDYANIPGDFSEYNIKVFAMDNLNNITPIGNCFEK